MRLTAAGAVADQAQGRRAGHACLGDVDAGGLLDRLLVAVTVGVSAMRLEAAVAVALIALRGRGVECHPALASRATRAHPRDESVALEATLLLGPNIPRQLREEDQHVFARRLA